MQKKERMTCQVERRGRDYSRKHLGLEQTRKRERTQTSIVAIEVCCLRCVQVSNQYWEIVTGTVPRFHREQTTGHAPLIENR